MVVVVAHPWWVSENTEGGHSKKKKTCDTQSINTEWLSCVFVCTFCDDEAALGPLASSDVEVPVARQEAGGGVASISTRHHE